MGEIVTAIYRAHPGQDSALEDLVRRHEPTLRASGLVTERATVLMRSADGSWVEVFEWVDADASRRAHEHPEVGAIWGAMMEVADFPCLADLPEATERFPHFRPVA
jgi:hypothetical protein